MTLKVGDKVEVELFSSESTVATILEGIITVVKVLEGTIRYSVKCLSTGIIYIVDEVRGEEDTLQ